MNILITGAKGQLGRSLQDILACPEYQSRYRVAAHDIDTLDLRNADRLHEVFSEFAPDVVINAAAYTAVDKAESDSDAAWELNSNVVTSLVAECRQSGARLIQISTDFVFNGRKSSPYLPEDDCDPLNVYGKSKRQAEETLLASPDCNGLIIRTAWLYSPYGNNFVKTMLRLMTERNELGVVCDQVGTPTSATTLAGVVVRAMELPELSGVYHWTDAGVASWYDFAVAIREEAVAAGLLSGNTRIQPIGSRQYPTPAKRPSFSVLDKSATCEQFSVTPHHWREALRDVLQTLRLNRG
ncbi:MAG: dTDP-4-dehydrorhamnose reductase [Ketobacteraceae bacterium]|nr:dTDP-4-dehydrorhamnose reductase [Ketobacteraceae bacterium]